MSLMLSSPRRRGARVGGVAALAALLTLIAAVGMPVKAYAASDSEPNDSVSQAQRISTGQTVQGTTPARTTDKDYYALHLSQPSSVRLSFRFSGRLTTSTVYELSFVDSSGTAMYSWDLRGADGNSGGPGGDSIFLPAGDVYFKVRGALYSQSEATYTFTISKMSTSVPVESEPNNTADAATPIVFGGSVLGTNGGRFGVDTDYYRFAVPSAQPVLVGLNFGVADATSLPFRVSIYDSSERLVKMFFVPDTDRAAEHVNWRTTVDLPKGTYSLGLATSSSATKGLPYELSIEGIDRYAGDDRYATSAAVSKASFEPGAPVAYVASGRNFPDALSGAPVAGMQEGPVLLTKPDQIPASIVTELKRLKPKKIVVLGSDGVISAKVKNSLAPYTTGTVSRLAGADRYATSAAISKASFKAGAPVAYIVNGRNFPDALSGAPVAAVNQGPVLLTKPDQIPASIVTELKRLKPKKIVILGSTTVVSSKLQTQLAKYTAGSVARHAGSDRYATSAETSRTAFEPGVPIAYVVNGRNFPDALSGAPAAGMNDAPVLLTNGSQVSASVDKELKRLKPKKIVVLGSSGVITEALRNSLTKYVVN